MWAVIGIIDMVTVLIAWLRMRCYVHDIRLVVIMMVVICRIHIRCVICVEILIVHWWLLSCIIVLLDVLWWLSWIRDILMVTIIMFWYWVIYTAVIATTRIRTTTQAIIIHGIIICLGRNSNAKILTKVLERPHKVAIWSQVRVPFIISVMIILSKNGAMGYPDMYAEIFWRHNRAQPDVWLASLNISSI